MPPRNRKIADLEYFEKCENIADGKMDALMTALDEELAEDE